MLQFLSYAKLLDFEIEVLSGIPYRVVEFRLDHFLKFQNPNAKSTNYYQLKKVRETLENLQSNLFVTHFSDTEFQRFAIFRIRITKNKKFKSCWIGKVWLIDELIYYQYPFRLPDFFQHKMKKDEFEVRFEIIRNFSSINVEKIFHVKKFLGSYSSIISNQRINNIKKYFIQVVKVLEEHDVIDSKYKVISNGKFHDVDQITPHNILEGFIIYEKLSI